MDRGAEVAAVVDQSEPGPLPREPGLPTGTLASQIGVIELTYVGKVFNNKGFSAVLSFGSILLVYFLMSYPLARLGARLEARLASSRNRRA